MTEAKPSVLVLGTYHMGNRGNKDMYKPNVSDVQAKKQQEEIREVIDLIKVFQPTKIAVEFETVRGDVLQQKYQEYINDELEGDLGSDEIYQIGFRLAKELGHPNIYPVDWNRPVGGVPLGYAYEFLKEADPEIYDQITKEREQMNKQGQQLMDTKSIREILSAFNSPSNLQKQQELYMHFALAADKDFYVGIDWLANYWYRRNLIIFANVKRLVETPEERILVIYGAGHKYLLDNFFKESGMFDVLSVTEFL